MGYVSGVIHGLVTGVFRVVKVFLEVVDSLKYGFEDVRNGGGACA